MLLLFRFAIKQTRNTSICGARKFFFFFFFFFWVLHECATYGLETTLDVSVPHFCACADGTDRIKVDSIKFGCSVASTANSHNHVPRLWVVHEGHYKACRTLDGRRCRAAGCRVNSVESDARCWRCKLLNNIQEEKLLTFTVEWEHAFRVSVRQHRTHVIMTSPSAAGLPSKVAQQDYRV